MLQAEAEEMASSLTAFAAGEIAEITATKINFLPNTERSI